MHSPEQVATRTAALHANWANRRKYVHTDATDAVIRRAYRLYRDYSNRNALAAAARQLGWPKYVVTRRGMALGLARTKERPRPWTSEEEAILEDWAFLSETRIAQKLARAGHRRSAVAIHLKMKRLGVRKSLDGYTQRSFAQLMGVDDHTVGRWIKHGMLRSVETGIACGPCNEKRYISIAEARRFILHCPDEIDLGKVEKFAFLDIVSGGKLCEEFRREVA